MPSASARVMFDVPALPVLLQPMRAALETTRMPLARLIVQVERPQDRMRSQLGGWPWWPEGTAWPTTPGGAPLYPLAQINLEDVPPKLGLPRRGLVQFFIEDSRSYGLDYTGQTEGQNGWRVVFWKDGPTGPAAAAPNLPEPQEHPLAAPLRPRALAFLPDTEYVSVSDYRFELLPAPTVGELARHAGVTEGAVLWALDEALAGEGHKVGGYPLFRQDDPRSPDDDRTFLLLQLDSHDGLMWGDAGTAQFFVAPDALQRGDVSDVRYIWQSA
ncbi:MAG: DUF1963 domain-containing protein [Rhodothermales bacterium]|nr:DUF1963 domain-containing protein [Rhodothermales bacterium]